jgi:integrase
MARIKLRYVNEFIDRHGKVRFYFRRRGYKKVALPDLPGSDAFMQAYREALAGQTALRLEIGASRTQPGTIAALVASYCSSPAFLTLKPATQTTYRNILEAFRREHGGKRVATLQREHVVAMLGAKIKTPTAANHWLRLIKMLMALAIDIGLRTDDPTRGIKNVSAPSDGFYTWSEADIGQFEAKHPIGSRARFALALLLYTAQRRSDVVKMGRQHLRGGELHIRQQKTGTALAIPVHPALQAIIDATPSDHLTFLTTAFGKPFTAAGFGNWFREMCNEAGLPRACSAHGLRKAACRRLAEAGCSEKVIASISGHTDLREVARYTRAADQARMARSAIETMRQTFPGTKTATDV